MRGISPCNLGAAGSGLGSQDAEWLCSKEAVQGVEMTLVPTLRSVPVKGGV